MTDPVTIGLVVCSSSAGTLNTSTFDNVSVTSGGSSLPVPWADSDVGSPALAGTAAYANGVFTVNGAGNDIWGTNDQSNYVSPEPDRQRQHRGPGHRPVRHRPLGEVGGRDQAVDGQRLRLRPGRRDTRQRHHLPARLQHRRIRRQLHLPERLAGAHRSGNTITAYSSPDGTTWTQIGTTTIAMTDPVTIGLFVAPTSAGTLNTSTFET